MIDPPPSAVTKEAARGSRPEFLRKPDFPWLTKDAGSRAALPDAVGTETWSVDDAIEYIRANRIGGSFWGSRAHRDRPSAEVGVAVDPWSRTTSLVDGLAAPQHDEELVAWLANSPQSEPSAEFARQRLADDLNAIAHLEDPFFGGPITVRTWLETLGEWRRVSDRCEPIVALAGIAWWKREAIERMLWLGRGRFPPHAKTAEQAVATAREQRGAVGVWPSRMPDGLEQRALEAGVPIVAIEDGFIRSIGLGAGLHPPASIIADTRGIYYDPRRPSDLEHMLESHPFPADLLERAAKVRALVVRYGISKYGADAETLVPARGTTKKIVLVPGQVEDDQSVLTGGGGVAGNLDLLKRARAAEPEAYLIFKPHPDVDAGFRVGRVDDAELLRHADEIVRDESMASLLKRVDAVHVLTSLTGFEALLRGLEVTTHGHPFYAGWGLTRDMAGPVARRTRRLTLDQLVAGALLLYPIYLDPVSQLPCPPEVLLERFRTMKAAKPTWVTRFRALQGRLAKLFGTTTN
jgi:capsular polysaccharide export protein